MSSAFDTLGLPDDADERAIKRAYAQRLKTTRPDEDPEGFQRLHAAYRTALQVCAWRAEALQDEADEADEGVQPARRSIDRDLEQEDIDRNTPHPLPDQVADHHDNGRVPLDSLPADGEAAQATEPSPDPPGGRAARRWTDRVPFETTGREFDADPEADAGLGAGPRPLSSPFGTSAVALDPWAARALAEQVLSMAATSDPHSLTAWLQAQPELWSLPDKAAVADAVVDALHVDRPPLGVAQFDALGEFFGLFDLRSGHSPELLLAVRDRLALLQALEGGDLGAVAERLQPEGSSRAAQQREIRRLLQQLRRPWSWPQTLAMALVPGLPSRLHRFTRTVRGMADGELPPGLDPRQGAFWEDAGDRERWSWPRAVVLALRLALYPLALPLLSWLLQPGTLPPEVAARRYLALFTALGLCWCWLRLSLAFARWQAVEDPPDVRWAWLLRSAAIPAGMVLGLTLHFLPGTEPLSWLLVPPLLMGTVVRVAGSSYSPEALVLVLRNGWVWVAVPLALALFGAFAGSGSVRGLVYVILALIGLGLWFGARARR